MAIKSLFYSIVLMFCIGLNTTLAQETILCSEIRTLISVENNSDTPTITNNTDNTVTLTFPQQYITDIFQNYIIKDFHQAYPNSSTLQKYYYIIHYSNELILDIKNNVSDTILALDDLPSSPISQDVIEALDGYTYDVVGYVTDTGNCSDEIIIIDCPYTEVPEDFNLSISFTYNTENDIIHAETNQLSPCGNSFSTYIKGGNPNDVDFNIEDYSLQPWENEIGTSSTSNNSEACHNIERLLYNIMGINCDHDYSYGNIGISIDQGTGNIKFTRKMTLLGFDGIELSNSNTASVEEYSFKNMRPFKTNNNPYLQIANLNNEIITVEIFNTLGKSIVKTDKFEANTIDLSNYNNGLYFIKLSNSNQQKVYKYILK